MTTNVLFIHGWGADGSSNKAKAIVDFPVIAPNFDHSRPNETKKAIECEIAKHSQDIILAGHSLGGFWAWYFSRKTSIPALLLNPSLRPFETLPELCNDSIYKGFYKEAIESSVSPIVALIEKGDEILDYRVAADILRGNAEVVLLDGGHHRFGHLNLIDPTLKRIDNNVITY